jgi:hypothetical protein
MVNSSTNIGIIIDYVGTVKLLVRHGLAACDDFSEWRRISAGWQPVLLHTIHNVALSNYTGGHQDNSP